MEHKKQFLVIGNMNAVTYREIFPLIKDNKVWLGNSRRKLPDALRRLQQAKGWEIACATSLGLGGESHKSRTRRVCFGGMLFLSRGYRRDEPMVAGEVGGRPQA